MPIVLTASELSETRAAMAKHARPDGTYNSTRIAEDLGVHRSTAQNRIRVVEADGNPEGEEVPKEMVREAWLDGPAIEIVSRKDNTFCFGAFGDLHAGSKYCRWDVREDLVRRAEMRGAQAIFDTGNWIEGDARFNQFDVVERGMERQLQLLARDHPKTKLEIYAISGDDHEGWYAQREGVNIGRYAQSVMRQAGHKWTDLVPSRTSQASPAESVMADVVDLKPKVEDGLFVVGSTVCLKSGGAIMTVRKPGKISVTVDWTDSNDNLCDADFPAGMLRHADPDEDEEKDKSAK